jgi:hypothetical protein
MRREAGHPVRTEKKNSRVRSSTSKLWPKHANIRYPHGSHDNSGNYAERDDVENEADEQPRCWANKGAREDQAQQNPAKGGGGGTSGPVIRV